VAIVGIGLDVTEVARIRTALEDPVTGERFRARVFTAAEQAYCDGRGPGRYESYAARFAAKEAVAKALGCGVGRELSLLDVEIGRETDGRPTVHLRGAGAATAAAAGVTRVHVALTHTHDLAIAQVVAEAGC
jgi:holo-[acyl-carrier protein] synthase